MVDIKCKNSMAQCSLKCNYPVERKHSNLKTTNNQPIILG